MTKRESDRLLLASTISMTITCYSCTKFQIGTECCYLMIMKSQATHVRLEEDKFNFWNRRPCHKKSYLDQSLVDVSSSFRVGKGWNGLLLVRISSSWAPNSTVCIGNWRIIEGSSNEVLSQKAVPKRWCMKATSPCVISKRSLSPPSLTRRLACVYVVALYSFSFYWDDDNHDG